MTYLISLIIIFSIKSQAQSESPISQISKETKVIQIGQKFLLNKAPSYHFSSKDLISFHDNNNRKSSEVFLIGLKEGFLNYSEYKNRKSLLILTKKQFQFFHQISDYVFNAPHLNFIFEKDELSVMGEIFDTQELDHLINICSLNPNARINIKIQNKKLNNKKDLSSNSVNKIKYYQHYLINTYDIETKIKNHQLKSVNKNHPLHFCLSNTNIQKKEYQITLALAEDEKINSLINGLGVQTALDWVFNPSLTISNFSGGAAFLKTKNQLKQSLNFSSSISLNSPVSFSDGTEVQVIDQQGVFQSRASWKKAETNITANLLEEDDFKLNIKIDLKQTLRTGDAGVFKTNNFSKKNQVRINKWVKILSFKKSNSYFSKRKTLKSTFLGSKIKETENSSYSLWVKAED